MDKGSSSANNNSSNSNKRQLDDENDDSESQSKKKERLNKKFDSVWKDWIDFLRNEENVEKFHPYSPEHHNVIRVGRGVSPKPNLDEGLYNQHLEIHPAPVYTLPSNTLEYLNGVIDSASLAELRKKIKQIPDADGEDEIVFNFLEDVFMACYNFYSSKQDLEEGETVFNDMLVFPFLKSVAKAVAENIKNSDAEFKVGETPLKAMMKQLDDKDESNLYKADGIIKLYGMKELEVLLLETSLCFGCKDNAKSCFDHHKGLFGALSMIKTIADESFLGSIETFAKIKVLFVHAADRTIYLWSVKYAKEGPAYELWLEGRLNIKPKFENKVEELPKVLNFYWLMKCLLEESVNNIYALDAEHIQMLKKFRYSTFPSENLSVLVNPSIMKLTEEEDKAGMYQLGPFYT
ncbi:hypothetical protein RMATCC62417_14563 [Rhizopus microsporus]|nr:hypothetical protein RMATCC62417_14563 [Rhizopus microsporus]